RSDERNNQKLVEVLRDQADRRAHYYCVIVLVRHAEDPQPIIADGSWNGEIIPEPRGEGGFGYDPYFFLPELGKTAAELPMEYKNRISHRGKALARLIESISQEIL
ncbi:MAG: non-canonical purine NTP pyrophosphatase, partial [Betaproteobacteria bacterium]|nr:non-canonical purine NTP pyrophosphatase [Betaproteobacteria bacterium]